MKNKNPVKLFKNPKFSVNGKRKRKQSPTGDLILGATTAIVGTALVLESSKLIGATIVT